MANNDDGLLREVEEELRRERLEKLWKQYGTYIIAAAAFIVLGVAGYKFLEARRISIAEEAGAQYEDALGLAADGKVGSATKEFEKLADEAPNGYQALARLQLAGILLKEGKKDEALKSYEALSSDDGADSLLRDFAALQAASLRLGEADWTEMQNRLNGLAGDDSPWRYSARELLGLAALKAGKPDEARSALQPLLADDKAPPSIVERAQIVLAEIAAADLAKTAASEPSAAPASSSAVNTTQEGDASTDTKKE